MSFSRHFKCNNLSDPKLILYKYIFKNLQLSSLQLLIFFCFLIISYPSISSDTYINNNEYKLTRTSNLFNTFYLSDTYNEFIRNKPILKSYGPLLLDINNSKYTSGVFLVPMLNMDNKPLFLAINCKESSFNIRDNTKWRKWFKPFFTYELNIYNDFCSG